MTISVEILLLVVTIVSVIIAYILMRLQIIKKLGDEAEQRGRLMQRIDVLEKTLDKIEKQQGTTDEKVGGHASELVGIIKEIESLRALIICMDKKLDIVLEQRNHYED